MDGLLRVTPHSGEDIVAAWFRAFSLSLAPQAAVPVFDGTLIALPKFGCAVAVNYPARAQVDSDSDDDAIAAPAGPPAAGNSAPIVSEIKTLGVIRPSGWVQRHTSRGPIGEATDAELTPIPIGPLVKNMSITRFTEQLKRVLDKATGDPIRKMKRGELYVPETVVSAISAMVDAPIVEQANVNVADDITAVVVPRGGEASCHGPYVSFNIFVALARTFLSETCAGLPLQSGGMPPVDVALTGFILQRCASTTTAAKTLSDCDDVLHALFLLGSGIASAAGDDLLLEIASFADNAQGKANDIALDAASERPAASAFDIGEVVTGGRKDFTFPASAMEEPEPVACPAPAHALAVDVRGIALPNVGGDLDIVEAVGVILPYANCSKNVGSLDEKACAVSAIIEYFCGKVVTSALLPPKNGAVIATLHGKSRDLLDMAAAHSDLLQQLESRDSHRPGRHHLHSEYATERAVVQAIASILVLEITRSEVTPEQQEVLRRWTIPLDPAVWAPHISALSPAVRRGWDTVVQFMGREAGCWRCFPIPERDLPPLQLYSGGSEWFASFAPQWYNATPSLQAYAAQMIQQYQDSVAQAVVDCTQKHQAYVTAQQHLVHAQIAQQSASAHGCTEWDSRRRFPPCPPCTCQRCMANRVLQTAQHALNAADVLVPRVLCPVPHEGPAKEMVVMQMSFPAILNSLAVACFAVQTCVPALRSIPTTSVPQCSACKVPVGSVRVADVDFAAHIGVVPPGTLNVRVALADVPCFSPRMADMDDDFSSMQHNYMGARNVDTFCDYSSRDNEPYCHEQLSNRGQSGAVSASHAQHTQSCLSRQATAAVGEVRTGNELTMTAECVRLSDVPLHNATVASVLHGAVASVAATTSASGKADTVVGREWAHLADALEFSADAVRQGDDDSRCVAARLVSICEAECAERRVTFCRHPQPDGAPTIAQQALNSIEDLCRRTDADTEWLASNIARAGIPGLLALASSTDPWMSLGTGVLPAAVVTAFVACLVAVRRGNNMSDDDRGVPYLRAILPLATAVMNQIRSPDRYVVGLTSDAVGRGICAAQPTVPFLTDWAPTDVADLPGVLTSASSPFCVNLFDGLVFSHGNAMSRGLPREVRQSASFVALFGADGDFSCSSVDAAGHRTFRTDLDTVSHLPTPQRNALAKARLTLHYEFTMLHGGGTLRIERVYIDKENGTVVNRLRMIEAARFGSETLPPFYSAPRATHWREIKQPSDNDPNVMVFVCGPTARDSVTLLTAEVNLNGFQAQCVTVPRGVQHLPPEDLKRRHRDDPDRALLDRRSCDKNCPLVKPFASAVETDGIHMVWPENSPKVEVHLLNFDRCFECGGDGVVRPHGSATQRLLTDDSTMAQAHDAGRCTVLPFSQRTLVLEDSNVSAHLPSERTLLLPRVSRLPEQCGPRDGRKTFTSVSLSSEFRTMECATKTDRLRLLLAIVEEQAPSVRSAWSKLTHQETAVMIMRQCKDNKPLTPPEATLFADVLSAASKPGSGWALLVVAAAVVWRMAESMVPWIPQLAATEPARPAVRAIIEKCVGASAISSPLVYAAKGRCSARMVPVLSDFECLAVQRSADTVSPPWDPLEFLSGETWLDDYTTVLDAERRLRFDHDMVARFFDRRQHPVHVDAIPCSAVPLSLALRNRMNQAQQAQVDHANPTTHVAALREQAASLTDLVTVCHVDAALQRFENIRRRETSSASNALWTALGAAATFVPSDILRAAYSTTPQAEGGKNVQTSCVHALRRVVLLERSAVVQQHCQRLEAHTLTNPFLTDAEWGVHRAKALALAALLRRELAARDWAPSEHPWWVAFEAERRIRIRLEQYDVWQAMQTPGSAVKLNMGEGKTKVIVPMLVLEAVFSGEGRVPRIAVLAQLLGDACRHFQHVLTGSVAQLPVFSFAFDRTIRLDQRFVGAARLLFRRWLPQQKGLLLWTREAIQSLHLQRHLSGREPVTIPTVKRPLDIIDECDALLAHNVALVYATGTSEPMEDGPLRWVAAFVVAMAAWKLGPRWLQQGLALSADPPVLLSLNEVQESTLREQLGRDLLFDGDLQATPLELLPMVKAARQHRDLALDAVTRPEVDIQTEDCLGPLEPYRKEILALRCFLACGIAQHCLTKRHMVQYGPPDLERGQQGKRIAVPYEAANQPSLRSEFSQTDVTVLLSFLGRLDTGLSSAEVNEAVSTLLQQSQGKQSVHYGRWWSWVDGLPDEKKTEMACHVQYLPRDVVGVDPGDGRQRAAMQTVLANCPYTAQFWLVHCVLPTDTRSFPTQKVASGWDVNPGSPHQVGFSGTDDTQDLMPDHVKFQPHPSRAIAAATGAMFSALKTQCAGGELVSLPDDDGWRAVITCAVARGCGAVVDTGALLAGHLMRDVAVETKEIIASGQAGRVYRGVYYFNARRDNWEIFDLQHESFNDAASSPLAAKDCLVIFDEARCRGADLVLHADALFLVTIGAGLTKDSLLQGVGRARQLLYGAQRVQFAAFEVLHRQMAPVGAAVTVDALVNWVFSNTVSMISRGVPLWAANAFRHKEAAASNAVADEPATISLESYGAPHCLCDATDVVQRLANRFNADDITRSAALKKARGVKCLSRMLDGQAERETEAEEEREVQQERKPPLYSPRSAPPPRTLTSSTASQAMLDARWPTEARTSSLKYANTRVVRMSNDFCAVVANTSPSAFALRRVVFAALTWDTASQLVVTLVAPREAAYASRNPTQFLGNSAALVHVGLLSMNPTFGGLIVTTFDLAGPPQATRLGRAVASAALKLEGQRPRHAVSPLSNEVPIVAALHLGGATDFGDHNASNPLVDRVADVLQGDLDKDAWFARARGEATKVMESTLHRASRSLM